jgi:uncharacterized protein (TIGR02466 family)
MPNPLQTQLEAARLLSQRQLHAQALPAYRMLAQQGLEVTAELAGTLMALGDGSSALQVLSDALATAPDQARTWLLRALVHLQRGDWYPALADLDHCLSLAPALLPARQKRATLHLQLDQLDEAREDFKAIIALQPADGMAHANVGIIHLRNQQFSDALAYLLQARALTPSNPQIQHSLANALAGCERLTEALPLYSDLEQRHPGQHGIIADHALALLAAGQTQAAQQRYRQVLQQAPADAWSLMGSYLCEQLAAPAATGDSLMNYAHQLHQPVDPLSGAQCRHWLGLALSHPQLRSDPMGKSTQGGQQSRLLDLQPGSAFQDVHALLQSATLRYVSHIAQAARPHSWHRGVPGRWRLQAWITVLAGNGGHQRPHIHPAGWASGVLYLDAGNDGASGGQLVFGHAPDHLHLDVPVHEHRIQPVDGELVMFPSYFLHHTTPYNGQRPRVCIAFDVVPA